MKIINLITAAAMMCMPLASCHASVNKIGVKKAVADSTHAMLHPDANTVYLDATGKKITQQEFMAGMKSGKFTFAPTMNGTKVVSIKLNAAEATVGMGATAPEFTGADISGRAFDLKTLKGKTVILNFWFTSCAPCMQEMPEMNGLVDKYKNDNSVVFLAVTYDSPEKVKAFLTHRDFKFNILAGRSDIVAQYHINGFPTSMVIDKTGNIAFALTSYDGTNVQQLDGVIGALKNVK